MTYKVVSLNFQVRVYGRAEYMQDLEHANNIAVAMQDWFEEWTGLVDPSDKVGMWLY